MAFDFEVSYLVRQLHAVRCAFLIYSGTFMYQKSHLQNGLDMTKVMNPLGRY